MYKKALVVAVILCSVVLAIPPSSEFAEQDGIETKTTNNPTDNPSKPTNPRPLFNWANGVLMIPESTTDSLGLYDPYDGTYLGALCHITGGTTPINAVQGPDGNIYLSDQVSDAVFMFDTAGTYLGVYADNTDGLDNVRGIAFRDGHLFVSISPSSGKAVKEFSAPHTFVRNFVQDGSDPFDVHFLPDGKAFVSDILSDNVDLFDTNGVFINTALPGDFPQQIQSDSVLPGAFLGALWGQDTIYDFELNGTIVGTCTLKYVRGVYRLRNGDILATSNYGIWSFNTTTGVATRQRIGTGFRFIELYQASSATPTCTIEVNIEGSGLITPSGTVVVNQGANANFDIIPANGHHLDSLIVDGENHGPDSTSFLFENVLVNHTMTGYFSINTYTISATAATGGTITPSGDVVVEYGADTTFYISANTNYVLDSVLVDGVSVGAVTSYPFTAVDANHTIHAMFTLTLPTGWHQTTSLPTQVAGKFVKDGGALVVVTPTKDAGYIYAFRGQKSGEFYMYDPVAMTWTAKETLPWGLNPLDPTKYNKKQVAKGGALCWNGANIIYATKGNSTKEFWAYDINTNTWSAKEYVSVPKKVDAGTGMVYKDGKVYLLAGNQKPVDENFYVYDEATNTWTTGIKIPTNPNGKAWKNGSGLTLIGNMIYAWKGKDKYCPLWSYDILTSVWTEVESCPVYNPILGKKVKTGDGGSITNDGVNIYTTKGGKQDFWKYVPGTPGTWTALDTIPLGTLVKKGVPKAGAALAYLDGLVYFLKGNKTDEFWYYNPGTKTNSVKPVTTASVNSNPTSEENSGFRATCFARTINYTVPVSGKSAIKLYNATGTLIKTIHDGHISSGNYSSTLNNISSGIYFLKYSNETQSKEVKVVIE